MDRRDFVKLVPLSVLGAGVAAQTANAQGASAPAAKVPKPPTSGGSLEDKKAPDWSKDFLTSDMQGLGPDGKPTGQKSSPLTSVAAATPTRTKRRLL